MTASDHDSGLVMTQLMVVAVGHGVDIFQKRFGFLSTLAQP